NRVILECWAGDWEAASVLADRMVDAFEQIGVGSSGESVWKTYVYAHFGRLGAVRASLESEPTSEPIVQAIWDRSLGLAELANGEYAAADLHLSESLAALDRVEFREPAVWRVHGDVIEAAVAAGDLDRARSLLGPFEQQAERSRIPWSLAVSTRCRAL